MTNKPIISEIIIDKDDIFKFDENPIYFKSIEFPKFSLGFQHFIHQSKDNMKVTQDFKDKKKVYHIINKYERYIDNYDKDISHESEKYFGQQIMNRSFYKLWELLFMFDVLPTSAKCVSVHLYSNSFVQATKLYRDKYNKKTVSDEHHTILTEKNKNIDTKFLNSNKITVHKNMDSLLKLKTKANFITSDGGFSWKTIETQEQDIIKDLLDRIITALKIQEDGGNFILKIYESFTYVTIKIICILASLYKNVYIAKPFMSRSSNSEKYIVCMNFKSTNLAAKIKKLENISKKFKNYLVDLFPEYNISNKILNTLTQINIEIANKQYITMNEIITFINSQNYLGETYNEKRKDQIMASEYWIKTFLPSESNFNSAKKDIMNNIEKTIQEIK
jgi:23S rRNA U2552 (ribose-2'-O)-methylase RlmE/FtsJ